MLHFALTSLHGLRGVQGIRGKERKLTRTLNANFFRGNVGRSLDNLVVRLSVDEKMMGNDARVKINRHFLVSCQTLIDGSINNVVKTTFVRKPFKKLTFSDPLAWTTDR